MIVLSKLLKKIKLSFATKDNAEYDLQIVYVEI